MRQIQYLFGLGSRHSVLIVIYLSVLTATDSSVVVACIVAVVSDGEEDGAAFWDGLVDARLICQSYSKYRQAAIPRVSSLMRLGSSTNWGNHSVNPSRPPKSSANHRKIRESSRRRVPVVSSLPPSTERSVTRPPPAAVEDGSSEEEGDATVVAATLLLVRQRPLVGLRSQSFIWSVI